MGDDLPESYDVIVVGTGLVESIVSAAAARIGKKVLHIDQNKYYGKQWATFSFKDIVSWASGESDGDEVEQDTEPPEELIAKESLSQFGFDEENGVTDVVQRFYITVSGDGSGENNEKTEEQVKDEFLSLSRKFNIDLAPQLLLYKGPMVELLIRSQVSRYLEFLSVPNILLFENNKVERVPCSKSDVFANKTVSVVDKRKLMKLLSVIQSHTKEGPAPELETFSDKTFQEFLQSQDVPETLQRYILYSISMSTQNTNCLEGVKRAQEFLTSSVNTSNSPFLWPLYGTSEILQAFCRLSAVFGGIYCLNRGPKSLLIDSKTNTFKGIWSRGQYLKANHVVFLSNHIPSHLVSDTDSYELVQRAVLVTNKPLMSEGKAGVSLLTFPLTDPIGTPVTLIELHSNSASCPKDYYIVHLVLRKTGDSNNYSDFDLLVDTLFETSSASSEKPRVLYSLYFTQKHIVSQDSTKNKLPKNVHLCSGPTGCTVDFHVVINEAETIFKQMYPDDEFLPTPIENNEEETVDDRASEEND